jgi:hypothetical protein
VPPPALTGEPLSDSEIAQRSLPGLVIEEEEELQPNVSSRADNAAIGKMTRVLSASNEPGDITNLSCAEWRIRRQTDVSPGRMRRQYSVDFSRACASGVEPLADPPHQFQITLP